MLNAQELAKKIVLDWNVFGHSVEYKKVTAREIMQILIEFNQVTRALGLPYQFTNDDTFAAAKIIENQINSRIDEIENSDPSDRG